MAVYLGDIGIVLVERASKEMGAAAVGGRDEVQVVGFGGLEDGFDGGFAGIADRGGRQASYLIGVEGGVDLKIGRAEILLPVVVGGRGGAVAIGDSVLDCGVSL